MNYIYLIIGAMLLFFWYLLRDAIKAGDLKTDKPILFLLKKGD